MLSQLAVPLTSAVYDLVTAPAMDVATAASAQVGAIASSAARDYVSTVSQKALTVASAQVGAIASSAARDYVSTISQKALTAASAQAGVIASSVARDYVSTVSQKAFIAASTPLGVVASLPAHTDMDWWAGGAYVPVTGQSVRAQPRVHAFEPILEPDDDDDDRVLEPLNTREQQVLDLLRHGFTNVQLSAALHLSESTIKNVVRTIFWKIGVDNRREAIRIAREYDLFSPELAEDPTARSLFSLPVGWKRLSKREQQIAFTLAHPAMADALESVIADYLGLKLSTLKKHLQRIYRKLRVGTRTGAALIALQVALQQAESQRGAL